MPCPSAPGLHIEAGSHMEPLHERSVVSSHRFRWERCWGWCYETHRHDTMCGGCCKIPKRPLWLSNSCNSRIAKKFCESQARCTSICILVFVLIFVLFVGLWVSGLLAFADYTSTTCSTSAWVFKDGYQVTDGRCRVADCYWNRGPTQCIDGQCACPPGFCSTGKRCILAAANTASPTHGTGIAEVFVVNSSSSGSHFPGAHNDVKTALLFSGGGMRSLSLAVGQLRALHRLGVMEAVDAISAVSGGAWATGIYMFANKSIDALLNFNFTTNVSLLTMDALGRWPGDLGHVANREMSAFFETLLTAHANRDDMWESFVKFTILDSVDLGNRAQPMAASMADVERIKKKNPLLQNVSFLIPTRQNPKVFVMGGAVLGQDGSAAKNVVSLQMSPDVSGWPFHPAASGRSHPELGGGFVETFVLGGRAPKGSAVRGEVPLPALPWSLSKALAVSSCAGAGQLVKYTRYTSGSFAPDGFLWPIPAGDAHDFNLGDGGLIDNAGLLPMLQRGAVRIVWFINTDSGLTSDADFCDADIVNQTGFPKGFLTNQMTDKFGYGTDSPGGYLSHNHVFDAKDMLSVACGLQTQKRQGKPAAFRQRHMVLRNDWWGIRGGTEVEIMYMYHEYSRDFVEQLPNQTRSELELGSAFEHYPFFKTMFQNGPTQFTQYTPEQTNLLAATAEFAVSSNSVQISSLLLDNASFA